MTRDFLTEYLTGEGCYKDEEFESPLGELWRNCVNGEICFIPNDEVLQLTTYCHIIYELRVTPPVEYDSDQYVYEGFRQQVNNKIEKTGDE